MWTFEDLDPRWDTSDPAVVSGEKPTDDTKVELNKHCVGAHDTCLKSPSCFSIVVRKFIKCGSWRLRICPSEADMRTRIYLCVKPAACRGACGRTPKLHSAASRSLRPNNLWLSKNTHKMAAAAVEPSALLSSLSLASTCPSSTATQEEQAVFVLLAFSLWQHSSSVKSQPNHQDFTLKVCEWGGSGFRNRRWRIVYVRCKSGWGAQKNVANLSGLDQSGCFAALNEAPLPPQC